IWLSLICRKVKALAPASAAWASPRRPKDFGTPPERLQRTPVPAQIMHSSAPRRLMLRCSSVSCSLISRLQLGRPARGVSLKETRAGGSLFPERREKDETDDQDRSFTSTWLAAVAGQSSPASTSARSAAKRLAAVNSPMRPSTYAA